MVQWLAPSRGSNLTSGWDPLVWSLVCVGFLNGHFGFFPQSKDIQVNWPSSEDEFASGVNRLFRGLPV